MKTLFRFLTDHSSHLQRNALRRRVLVLVGVMLLALGVAACGNRGAPAEPAAEAETPAAVSEDGAASDAAEGDAEDAAEETDEGDAEDDAPASSAGVSPLSSPLASPLAQPTPEPTDVPAFEAEEGAGVVTGRLMLIGENGPEPVPEVIIALASVLRDDAGNESVVGYDRTTAPADVTDENGFFAITDAPPDTYGFILDTVISSYLLNLPDFSGNMLVTVEEGEQIDMGALVYEVLPLPGATEPSQ